MKKILFFSLFIGFKMFGQSMTLTPSAINKQNYSIDDDLVIQGDRGAVITGIATGGTNAATTPVSGGRYLFRLDVKGYNGFQNIQSAGIEFKTTQIWSPTGIGTKLSFITTENGSLIRDARMVIDHNGRVGIGVFTPTAQLDVERGTAPDGTAIFRGTIHVSHFNYATNEDTYIRGGKNGSNVIINDVAGLGNVSIGPGTATEKFHVFGNIKASGTVCASNISCPSDIRFKKNIVLLNNSLTNLLKIKGVRYDFRKDEFPEKNFSEKSQIGFIAQDIEKIFPEMVFTDAQGYKSVDYARLTPVLVEAIKELTLKNQTLASRLDKIEAMLTDIQPNNENTNSKK
jgi:Chaperone of endosialidase